MATYTRAPDSRTMRREPMAAARKKKRNKPSSSSAPGAVQVETSVEATPETPRRRDLRPFIYLGLDLVLVTVWSVLLTSVIPNRHGWAAALTWAMVTMGLVMAGSMLVRSRWGWRAATLACSALLVAWIALVVMLLSTAAFLTGVYGGFGQAAGMGTLIAALLSLQLIALLPAFQLKYLMTRAGRRHFGLAALWK